MTLSKARGLTLGGTPSPRHQRGAKRISQEALNTQPRGPGSEGNTGPGKGLVSEPENLSLVFLANKPHQAYSRPQSGRLCRPPRPPSTLGEGTPPRTLVRGQVARASARTLREPALRAAWKCWLRKARPL